MRQTNAERGERNHQPAIRLLIAPLKPLPSHWPQLALPSILLQPPDRVEPEKALPRIRWSIGITPTLTAQHLTIPGQPGARVESVLLAPALGRERWGLQAFTQATYSLSQRVDLAGLVLYSGSPRWESYTQQTDRLRVTYSDSTLNPQSILTPYAYRQTHHSLSVRVEARLRLGSRSGGGAHRLRGGLEWQQGLTSSETAFFGLIGYSRQLSVGARFAYLEPQLRYGLSRYHSSQHRFLIRPTQVGLSFRIDLLKH